MALALIILALLLSTLKLLKNCQAMQSSLSVETLSAKEPQLLKQGDFKSWKKNGAVGKSANNNHASTSARYQYNWAEPLGQKLDSEATSRHATVIQKLLSST